MAEPQIITVTVDKDIELKVVRKGKEDRLMVGDEDLGKFDKNTVVELTGKGGATVKSMEPGFAIRVLVNTDEAVTLGGNGQFQYKKESKQFADKYVTPTEAGRVAIVSKTDKKGDVAHIVSTPSADRLTENPEPRTKGDIRVNYKVDPHTILMQFNDKDFIAVEGGAEKGVRLKNAKDKEVMFTINGDAADEQSKRFRQSKTEGAHVMMQYVADALGAKEFDTPKIKDAISTIKKNRTEITTIKATLFSLNADEARKQRENRKVVVKNLETEIEAAEATAKPFIDAKKAAGIDESKITLIRLPGKVKQDEPKEPVKRTSMAPIGEELSKLVDQLVQGIEGMISNVMTTGEKNLSLLSPSLTATVTNNTKSDPNKSGRNT